MVGVVRVDRERKTEAAENTIRERYLNVRDVCNDLIPLLFVYIFVGLIRRE